MLSGVNQACLALYSGSVQILLKKRVKVRGALQPASGGSGTQQVRVGSGGWVYLEPCLQLGRLFRPHGERTHVYRAAELQPASSSSGTPGAWGWLEHRSSTTRGQECLLRYIWWGLGFIRWFALQSRSVRTPTSQLHQELGCTWCLVHNPDLGIVFIAT